MPETVFLGIDPSITNTGVVLLGSDGRLLTAYDGKTAKHSVPDTVKGMDSAFRYMAQTRGILEEVARFSAGSRVVIGFEDYAFNATHQAFSLGEYGGVLKAALADFGREQGAEMHLLAPTHVKKFGAGNGMAAKEEMMRAAVAECPELAEASSDVCDAFFMAKIVLYRTDPALAVAVDRGNPLLRHRLGMANCKE